MMVCHVVGARPNFMKLAPVFRALKTGGVDQFVIHTGQHYDSNMSAVFFRELEIPEPNVDLGVGSGTHGVQTGLMMQALDPIFLEQNPQWVVVYGDTNSTLAGALAAVKLHLAVAHVEAGLRSYNRRMPEEINRILTDQVSQLLFVPTETAVRQLLMEGVNGERVQLVGDVMFDSARYFGLKAKSQSTILKTLELSPREYVLATVHRAENTDHPESLRNIVSGLSRISSLHPVVVPLHPRTRVALARENLLAYASRNLRLIEAVGYLDMVMLEKNAKIIVTDSGGIQKEAFFYRVPCVTLRTETEWTELVSLGWNKVIPPISAQEIEHAVLSQMEFASKEEARPYGDGNAAERIARALVQVA